MCSSITLLKVIESQYKFLAGSGPWTSSLASNVLNEHVLFIYFFTCVNLFGEKLIVK